MVLMALKGVTRMGQKLITPLIVEGLADLVLMADLGHRPALETLNYARGCGFGILLPAFHS